MRLHQLPSSPQLATLPLPPPSLPTCPSFSAAPGRGDHSVPRARCCNGWAVRGGRCTPYSLTRVRWSTLYFVKVEEGADNEAELQALPYVLAVQAFCIVDPTLCTPVTDPSQFVVTLQPYLKKQVESKPTAQLLESIIFVIDAVLPLIRKPPHTVVEELEQDLKQMIVRHSFLTVVHACIKCLSTLSNAAGRGPRISEYLVNIVYKHLNGSNFDSQRPAWGHAEAMLLVPGDDVDGKEVKELRCLPATLTHREINTHHGEEVQRRP